jgi:hypothetical protein
MGDEWGIIILNSNNYKYNYQNIFNKIFNFIDEYRLEDIVKLIGENFGINPFDLFILKKFIFENNITNVVEFGAGSSSKFIDSLGIKRTSFALQPIFYDIKYEKINLYEQYNIIQKFIKITNLICS